MEQKINTFTEGPILGPLLRFSLPVLLALLLQSLYGAVDLLIVGKFAATQDVSGVSVGSQLMMTASSFVSSMAMGTTILLGQRIGMGDQKSGGRIIGATVVLFVGIGAVFTVALPIFSGALATAMNAPPEAYRETQQYIMICGFGSIMIVLYHIFGGILRGLGDSKTPLMTVAIACGCNVLTDLLLVAVFHMGAAGAAIATVASQTVSVLVSLWVLSRRKLPFEFGLRDVFHPDWRILGRIVRFGAPIALQDFMVGFSFLVNLSIVNKLGLNASAGVGVAEKVCMIIMLVPIAFMQSMSAYVAQNYGAGRIDRAVKGLRVAICVSVAFGAVMGCLAFFRGDLLCSVFARDDGVITAGFEYLRAYGIDCLLTSFLFCFVGYFNGLGKTGFVMLEGIVSAFAVRIPIAWIMSIKVGTLFSIGLSVPLSTLSQIIMCFVFFAIIRKKDRAKTAAQQSEA